MKREIKFRGRKLDGTWLYGYYTIFEGYHKIWCEKHSTPYDVDGETVGEFTGLKDKNANNTCVYEGDIVSLDGIVIGNKHENADLLKDKTNLLIEGFGTKNWTATEQEGLGRGLKYS